MFTGIVRELGTVARLERSNGLLRLSLYAPETFTKVERLDSVAVNGVCLSVVSLRDHTMTFEIIPESQRLTNLARLRRGSRVNVESSLSLADRLGGQLLFGHVDGLGTVVGRRERAGELVLDIRVGAKLGRLLVPKGPIAVDGISLTVGTVRKGTFTIHLIPETLRQTTLRGLHRGDRVNVELDYFAKLVAQFLRSRTAAAG